ncbi:MAG: hypothetical protein QOE90_2217 [Thermoplasmata archaeon]|jgi:hypothetical protein|nr:hypothetical protein [Thermoplasmata archaeon]
MHIALRPLLAIAAVLALVVPVTGAGAPAPSPLAHGAWFGDGDVTADAGFVPTTTSLPPGAYVTPNETSEMLDPNATIGPGALLAISSSTEKVGSASVHVLNGCTANWVWKDQNGTLYLGTAGHCVLGNHTATHGPGADTDAAGVTVYVCPNPCQVGGATGLAFATATASASLAGTWFRLGKVAYARQPRAGADPADDFALVAVPASLERLLGPRMPMWGGPDRVASIAPGDLLVMHGNGLGVGEVFPTKSRQGVFHGLTSTGNGFRATVWAAEGDSGSPVGLIASSGTPAGVGAAGILTACLPTASDTDTCTQVARDVPTVAAPQQHLMTGPTLDHAIALAQQANLCVRVVLAGEDPVSAPTATCP